MFSGVWFSEELYVLTLSGAEEHTALRVQPLEMCIRDRNKMDDLKDLVNISKLNELLNKKEAEEEKKASKVVWVFAIIGIINKSAGSLVSVRINGTSPNSLTRLK